MITLGRAVAVGFLAGISCSGGDAPSARHPGAASSNAAASTADRNAETVETKTADEATDSSPGAFEVSVRDRATLSELEASGFGLGELVTGARAETTAELHRHPGMKSIFDVLRADVRSTTRAQPLAKVTSSDGFRLFDERWLESPEMRFSLVGVFNRLDRKAFYPGTCGEVRFVYRLAYQTSHAGAPMAGRLPLTLNVVFLVRGDRNCQAVARSWRRPSATKTADWLLSAGPLAPLARNSWTLKSVETNLQSFRIQSFAHPTLAGHIDYVLRVFHAKSEARDRFEPAPMENMPDVSLLSKNKALRAELLAYLREPAVLASVDQGTLVLPERFLATRAVSVSPRGLSRLANRPFRKLFEPAEFADLPLAGRPSIGSPTALLRRLDGATCTGCHQSHSIAGFHYVGEDDPEHPAFDALLSGASAHLEADLTRRRAYVEKLGSDQMPEEYRPIPERQGPRSGFGAPCGLGDPGFSSWTCSDGLTCTKLEDVEVGACLEEKAIGAPCQHGEIVSKPQPSRDLVAAMKDDACDPKQYCHNNRSGFPLGACEATCTSSAPGATCADFLDADAFQNCLRSRSTFGECAQKHVYGAGLRACDADDPCRQDYVCVRSRTPGVGACAPPYFVYQLRLDGYPLMR